MVVGYLRWVLVRIGSLFAFALHDLPDCIDSESIVWVHLFALSIDDFLGKLLRINATGKKQGVIVVKVFSLRNCSGVSTGLREGVSDF